MSRRGVVVDAAVFALVGELRARDLLQLARHCARACHVTLEGMLSKDRTAPAASARAAFYAALLAVGWNPHAIGRLVRRHHSTVSYALEQRGRHDEETHPAAARRRGRPAAARAARVAGGALAQCVPDNVVELDQAKRRSRTPASAPRDAEAGSSAPASRAGRKASGEHVPGDVDAANRPRAHPGGASIRDLTSIEERVAQLAPENSDLTQDELEMLAGPFAGNRSTFDAYRDPAVQARRRESEDRFRHRQMEVEEQRKADLEATQPRRARKPSKGTTRKALPAKGER